MRWCRWHVAGWWHPHYNLLACISKVILEEFRLFSCRFRATGSTIAFIFWYTELLVLRWCELEVAGVKECEERGLGEFIAFNWDWGMKEMPLLTESMAPVVASFNQASSSVRSCARIRDSDEAEAPLNKRLCSLRARVSTGIQSSERKTEFQSSTSSPMCEDVECDESFGPGTPTKGEGASESSRKISAGGWESLELCLLERVTRSLSVKDLSRLSQVLGKTNHPFSKLLSFPMKKSRQVDCLQLQEFYCTCMNLPRVRPH